MDDSVETRKILGEIQQNVRSIYRRLSYILPMLAAIKAYYDLNGEVNDSLARHVDEEMLSILRLLTETVALFQSDDIPF